MAQRGTTQQLDIVFYDGPGGAITDPNAGTVGLQILYDGDVVFTVPSGIVKDSAGTYHYDWNIPLDSPPGLYTAAWSGIMPGDTTASYGYVNITVTATPVGLPNFRGCIWPIDPGCLGAEWGDYNDEVQQRAITLASASMSKLTAGRVGDCPIKVRPDVRSGLCGLPGGPLGLGPIGYGYGYEGGFLRGWGAGRYDGRELTLPGPVNRIDEVMIDGVVINPSEYRIVDRTGGVIRYTGDDLTGWPVTQDWNAEADEVGAFTITYLNTAAVDSQGANAAGLLAAEFAKVCASSDSKVKCKFPSNITSLVRQGLTIEFVAGSFPGGLTGIREVDLYTAQWNTKGRGRATLLDPGAPRHEVVTR